MEDSPKRRPGRPPALKQGRMRGLYLDDDTADMARSLGEGNMSAGIRLAVRVVHEAKTKLEGEEP